MSAEPNIRNRVAGAVVLVSLAVIFLPLILDGKKKNQVLESTIPDKPKSGEIILVNIEENTKDDSSAGETTSLTIPAEEITTDSASSNADDAVIDEKPVPAVTDNSATNKTTQDKTVAEKPKPEPEVIKAPTPKPERTNRPIYADKGHLVQIGSFSTRDNASRLVSTLQKASQRAYYKSGTSGGKPIYRVFSGPYLERSDAEKAIVAIKKLASVNPIIVTYDPVKHAQG